MNKESIKYGVSPYREGRQYVNLINYVVLFLAMGCLIGAALI